VAHTTADNFVKKCANQSPLEG